MIIWNTTVKNKNYDDDDDAEEKDDNEKDLSEGEEMMTQVEGRRKRTGIVTITANT